MARQSNQPLGPSLLILLGQRGWTLRDLDRKTSEVPGFGRGLGRSYLSEIVNGRPIAKEENRKKTIELLAAAFNIDPRYFLEYREILAAEEARRVMRRAGLDQVLAKLRELD